MIAAQDFTKALLGKWHGSYGSAPCPVCQPEGRKGQNALTLTDSGGRLLLHCKKYGCGFRDVLAATGVAHGSVAVPDPIARHQAEAQRKVERDKRAAQAQRLWEYARPIGGTVAETYLNGRVWRDKQDENPASIRMRTRVWGRAGRA